MSGEVMSERSAAKRLRSMATGNSNSGDTALIATGYALESEELSSLACLVSTAGLRPSSPERPGAARSAPSRSAEIDALRPAGLLPRRGRVAAFE